MKKLTFLVIALLVFGGTAQAQTKLSAQLAASNWTRVKDNGSFAQAVFTSNANTCAPTYAFVNVNSGSGGDTIFTNIFRFNNCTGVLEWNASGTTVPDQLSFTRKSASVNTWMTVTDQLTASSMQIFVQLTWSATSAYSQAWDDNYTYGDGSRFKYSGTMQSATVAGHINDGPVDWALGSADQVYIGTSSGMVRTK